MKRYLASCIPLLFLLLGLLSWSCDHVDEDVIPVSFQEFKLYPDEVYYVYDRNVNYDLLLTPLRNDSLRTEVTLTYSQPVHGQLITGCWGEADGRCYIPNEGFFGVDSLTYTVCSNQTCITEKIKIIVEEPKDFSTCVESLGADSLETTINTPKEIKIFANDTFCAFLPYAPITIQPEHGTIRFYDHMGSYKNPTFIYTPNKNFVGEDSFTYSVDFLSGMQYMKVKVKVNPK